MARLQLKVRRFYGSVTLLFDALELESQDWAMTSQVGMIREVERRYKAEHYDQLLEKYAGQWIVLEGERVISADKSEYEAGIQARAKGITIPYLVFIPSDDRPFYG
jgi:hypothetical protein